MGRRRANVIDLDANKMEAEFQTAMKKLIALINAYLKLMGYGDFSGEAVEIVFNRDIMMNVSEVIQSVKDSVGLLSTETLIGQHPWVTDVRLELERIGEERETAAPQRDAYDGADEAEAAE